MSSKIKCPAEIVHNARKSNSFDVVFPITNFVFTRHCTHNTV